MKHRSFFSRAVHFCIVILVGVLLVPLAPEQPQAAVQAWTRNLDPVVINGSQLSLFNGVSLSRLFVYAYNGSTWSVVPFQFDEVDSEGSFVLSDGGVLDGNDQLVFMASDLGVMATPYEWPNDALSRIHSRYEVHVTNPLNSAEEGWVYVFYSATMAPTFDPYVTWDGANNRIVASTYTVGYTPLDHLGLDSLQFNDHPGDVLDRTKLRVYVHCVDSDGGETWPLTTEESDDVIDTWTTPDIHGPVRVGGGTLDESTWSYASMFTDDSSFTVDEDDVDPDECVEFDFIFFQASEDWLDPSASGMAPMTYFDSVSPAGVPVDGVHEQLPTSFPTWRQVSGAKGSLVQAMDIDGGGSTVANYYNDGFTEDIADTGDELHFGDAGFKVWSPAGTTLISTAHYVVGPSPVSVGGTYRDYFDHPLQATATAQDYLEPAPNAATFDPKFTYIDLETTFTARALGLEPLTYNWEFGDGGSTESGNPVIHTFTVTGTVPVTLTVTNDYDTYVAVRPVFVIDPDTQLPTVYLPMLFRNAP